MGITFCGYVFTHEHMRSVQRGINYRISRYTFIADWTIIMG